MKKLLLFSFLIGSLIVQYPMIAQNTSQKKILYRPKKYKPPTDPNDLSPTLERLDRLWVVWSDRDSNSTFTQPGGDQKFKTLKYMEEFFAVEENGQYLHLFKDPQPIGTVLSNKAEDYGWIWKKNLLLWESCLVTKQGMIARKAMVMNTLQSIIPALRKIRTSSEYQMDILKFKSGPEKSYNYTEQESRLFQIFFVYKQNDGWVLLGKSFLVAGNDRQSRMEDMIGWVPESRLTFWDHRKAVEPNWEAAAADERISGNNTKIFKDSLAAINYKQGKVGESIIWESDTYKKRPIGEWRRFPILRQLNQDKDIIEVGTMGNTYLFEGDSIIKEIDPHIIAGIQQKVDNLTKNQRKVNIAFVIDGTKSMGPYFGASAEAIKICMNKLQEVNPNNSFKFGAVIYRDLSEQERKLEIFPLQEDVDAVISFLDPSKAFDNFDTDEPEAVLYGLKKALRQLGFEKYQSNILILVGDAGNHHRKDETSVSEQDVIATLCNNEFDCHLLVFQVHNKNMPTYDEFITQTKDIIFNTAKIKYDGFVRTFPSANFLPPILEGDSPTFRLINGVFVSGVFGVSPNQQMEPEMLTKEVTDAIVKINGLRENMIANYNRIIEGRDIKLISQENYEPMYTNSFAPQFIYSLAKGLLSMEEIEIVKRSKLQLYIPGYTTLRSINQKYPLFKQVLFLDQTELSRIVLHLQDLTSSADEREHLAKAWKIILEKYLGSPGEMEKLTLEQINEKVFGLPGTNEFLAKVRLKDITDPAVFKETDLTKYIKRIKDKYKQLSKILNDPESYEYKFRTNEVAYYWIAEDLIP